METQPNQHQKGGTKALWIVLIIVALAVVGYGIYAYVPGNTNNANNANVSVSINTDTDGNRYADVNVQATILDSNVAATSNQAININSTTNTNTDLVSSTSLPINSSDNTNVVVSNTNTTPPVIVENWPTYTNTTIGYSLQYPPEWKYAENESFFHCCEHLVRFYTGEQPSHDTATDTTLMMRIDTYERLDSQTAEDVFNQGALGISSRPKESLIIDGVSVSYYYNIPWKPAADLVLVPLKGHALFINNYDISSVGKELFLKIMSTMDII